MMPKLAKLCDSLFSNVKLKCTSSCCTAEVTINESEHQQPPQQSPSHTDNNQPPLKLKDIITQIEQHKPETEQKTQSPEQSYKQP